MSRLKCYRMGSQEIPLRPIEKLVQSSEVTPGERITVLVESIADKPTPGAALLEIHFQDKANRRLEIPNWTKISKKVGPYHYLNSCENGISLTRIILTAPAEASKLTLVGNRWRRLVTTSVLGEPVIIRESLNDAPVKLSSGTSAPSGLSEIDRRLDLQANSTRARLELRSFFPNPHSKGTITVEFLSGEGKTILPPFDSSLSSGRGYVIELNSEGEGGNNDLSIELSVPKGSSQVRLKGESNVSVDSEISVCLSLESFSNDTQQISDFLDQIPNGDHLVVIDTTAPPIGDDTRALRPNNLAMAFARKGLWVIFLPFSSLQEYEPRVGRRLLQVPRSENAQLIEEIRNRNYLQGTFICSSFCSISSITFATLAKTLGWQVVYEARDDMEEFNRVGYSKWYSPMLERAMLRLSDKCVSVSTALDEKLLSLLPSLGDHVVIPNGVRQETIDQSRGLRTPSAFAHREHSQVVGYVGHLTPSWFDWPKVLEAARKLPDFQFEIIGHGAPADLDLPQNVKLLGAMTHEELTTVVSDWKVGLIPFLDIPLTRSVDPNKIYEYFSWGLRTVSAPMGMVEKYPLTYVYRSVEEMVQQIRSAVEDPYSAEEFQQLDSMIKKVSWDLRADALIDYYGIQARSK